MLSALAGGPIALSMKTCLAIACNHAANTLCKLLTHRHAVLGDAVIFETCSKLTLPCSRCFYVC